MGTKDRLELVAVVLTATGFSPSPDLREMGERLLANEMRDLERSIRLEESREVEAFRAFVAGNPSQLPVTRICEESAERVQKIMGRG